MFYSLAMDPRAEALISALAMRPHPEGGYYCEVHRSASRVQTRDARSERAALTTIYFLLTEDDISRWHSVASDEAWHFYEGAPLELLTAGDAFDRIDRRQVGLAAGDVRPVHVVPAHVWQAARSTGAFTLVGCTVGPGFEFDDFCLLVGRPDLVPAARAHPDAAPFI